MRKYTKYLATSFVSKWMKVDLPCSVLFNTRVHPVPLNQFFGYEKRILLLKVTLFVFLLKYFERWGSLFAFQNHLRALERLTWGNTRPKPSDEILRWRQRLHRCQTCFKKNELFLPGGCWTFWKVVVLLLNAYIIKCGFTSLLLQYN